MLILTSNFNNPPLLQDKPVIPKRWVSGVLPLMMFGTFLITLMPRPLWACTGTTQFQGTRQETTLQGVNGPLIPPWTSSPQDGTFPFISQHACLSQRAFCQSLWECFRNQVSSINGFLFVQELWTCFKELVQICLPWRCPSLTKPISTVPQHKHLITNSAVSFLVSPYLPTVSVEERC